MIKISNINFSKKTIENLEVSCDDMKEIKFEFLDNTLRLSIVKENDKEVIEEIIKEEMEDDEVVKEEPTEDVIEEKVIEKLTIDDLKKIIYETIPKKILLRPTLEQLSKYMITLTRMMCMNC